MQITKYTLTTTPDPIFFSDLNEDRMSFYHKFVFGETLKIKVENNHTYEFIIEEIKKADGSGWRFLYNVIMIKATSDEGITKDINREYTIYFDSKKRSGHVRVRHHRIK